MGQLHEEMLRHYEQGGLLQRILEGLKALGKDLDVLTHEDLAQVPPGHAWRNLRGFRRDRACWT